MPHADHTIPTSTSINYSIPVCSTVSRATCSERCPQGNAFGQPARRICSHLPELSAAALALHHRPKPIERWMSVSFTIQPKSQRMRRWLTRKLRSSRRLSRLTKMRCNTSSAVSDVSLRLLHRRTHPLPCGCTDTGRSSPLYSFAASVAPPRLSRPCLTD